MNFEQVPSSKTNGKLAQFQDKLLLRYQNIIKTLRDEAEKITKKSNCDLQMRMSQFQSKKEEIKLIREQILDSMEKSEKSFDELRSSLNETRLILDDELKSLKIDVIQIYDSSFESLKPIIQKALNDSKEIVPQIPEYAKNKLELEIQTLNHNYTETKSKLINVISSLEQSLLNDYKEIELNFEQGTQEFYKKRSMTLLASIKETLNPEKPIDYSDLCTSFHTDEHRFQACFIKTIDDLSLILPPTKFSTGDFDEWYQGCQEIIESHTNFIAQFKDKFKQQKEKIDVENSKLVENVEKELECSNADPSALQTYSEFQPVAKASEKAHQLFYEKIIKYWDNRIQYIPPFYESICTFFKPLITLYENYFKELDEIEEKAKNDSVNLKSKSDELLAQFEEELSLKINEIETMIDQNEIQKSVQTCKTILDLIEKEYRSYYEQNVKIYDDVPLAISKCFENCESKALQLLKLMKTSNDPDVMTAVTPTSNRSNKKEKGKPANIPQPSKSKTKKSTSKPSKNSKSNANTIVQPLKPLFSFILDNYIKYIESEPLLLFPIVEEYIEEDQAQPAASVVNSSRKANTQVRPNSRASKSGGTRNSKNAKKNSGSSSNTAPAEPDIPNLPLFTNIIQIDGESAIKIFIPQNSMIEEILNHLREMFIRAINEKYKEAYEKSKHEEDKFNLAEDLNLRIRNHSPRATYIEITIAQARIMTSEVRRLKLEKFFKYFTEIFNKNLALINRTIESTKASIFHDVDILKNYVNGLTNVVASKDFAQYEHMFGNHIKEFHKNREDKLVNLQNNVNSFRNRFVDMINKFVESYDASPNSEDMALCKDISNKVTTQIDTLMKIESATEEKIINDTNTRVTQLQDEFSLKLPHNKSDVQFIEKLQSIYSEASKKYSSFLYKNKESGDQIKRAIERVTEICNMDFDDILQMNRTMPFDLISANNSSKAQILSNENEALDEMSDDDFSKGDEKEQKKIIKIIESLDNARVLLINRAKFLGCLQSTIPFMDPIPITFNFANNSVDLSVDSSLNTKKPAVNNSKSANNTRNKGKNSTPENKNVKKNQPKTPAKKSNGNNNLSPDSLISHVNEIETWLNQKTSQASTEYYNHVKTRKYPIIRTNEIPATSSEILNITKQKWKETTADLETVVKTSTKTLLEYVVNALDTSKCAIEILFNLFNDFSSRVNQERKDAFLHIFQQKINETKVQRKAIQSKVNMKVVNENNQKELSELIIKHKISMNEISSALELYKTKFLTVEEHQSQSFLTNLIGLTNIILHIFDNFMFEKDTNYSKEIANAHRMTMAQLMKEKKRQEENATNEINRPFKSRDWDQLNATFDVLKEQKETQSPSNSRPSSSVGSSHSGRKSAKKRKSDAKILSPNDLKNGEKTPVQRSLETPIHRFIVLQRNRIYDVYSTDLKQEMEEFNSFVSKIENENVSFEKYFNESILNLNPDADLDVPIPEIEPDSNVQTKK